MFRNRQEAGERLADMLERYRDTEAVVLALPRGGVPLGRVIADTLHLPLDIVVVRKVGHPDNPEYALCAVNAEGVLRCDEGARKQANQQWLEGAIAREQQEAVRRESMYRGGHPPEVLVGKTAIIVDDGIATGLSMDLAVAAVLAQEPERVVVAVPVAPEESVARLEKAGADVLTVVPPGEFLGAVGAHYVSFPQVADTEVLRFLGRSMK